MGSRDEIDPDEFVRENREKVLAIIMKSDDELTRACAWTFLDRHTPEVDIEVLQEELKTVANREDDS